MKRKRIMLEPLRRKVVELEETIRETENSQDMCNWLKCKEAKQRLPLAIHNLAKAEEADLRKIGFKIPKTWGKVKSHIEP
jgi:translation initiation factor 2 alpha subunit (eIF-2alpha)